ncbi:MAG: 3-oxoacyl-[acyl-carrier-protein] reductase, partial [Candidatus Aminicenantes bacterium]|nr:3-oxoacyl-[acyl-carrier-protein] reductase [Candidatus Aminicenantes bacterium]
ALITGGSRGIGKAIAERLIKEGAKVWIADINEEMLKETASAIGAYPVKMDVTSEEEVISGVKTIIEKDEKIDFLVNNAGITKDGLLMRMKLSDWETVLKVNLTGAFLVTREVIKGMIRRREGAIVNIASVVGEMGNAGQANYSASKAGLIGFTKSVAKEVASRNIRVNAVAPGFVITPMTEKLPEKVKEEYFKAIPLGRFSTPEEIASVVAFLLSDEASYITGEVIKVNGGLYI